MISKFNNVLVLGYFGYVTNQLDGQTIKTRNIYELLKLKEEDIGVVECFDTQCFRQSKLNLIKMFIAIMNCRKLVYLPAHSNLKYLFPLIYILTKIKKIDIMYLVVGGWLTEYLQNKKIHVFFLKRIKGVFTETTSLKENLENTFSLENVHWFPNFRNQSFLPEFKSESTRLKVVFMARINQMKGLDTVFHLADYCIKNNLSSMIHIDFYGPIENSEYKYFTNRVQLHSNIKYVGVIQPDLIYSTLAKYDLLILPTKYYTEGFPGSILDAYISGIPVVVTNWKHAHEFVQDGITGFIVPFENGEQQFIDSIISLYEDRSLLNRMKQNAYQKSKEYSSDRAWEIIEPYLN